jgi:hypothetical protein
MIPRLAPVTLLVVALWMPAAAQTTATRPKTRAVAKPVASKAGAAAKPGTATQPRRLQDIHIEGEIPVPQVLFITARDQRRLMDFQHRRYLRTSRELGESTAFPSCIALIRNRPTDAGKEISR